MDFTREPIIESVVTPREGCKLVLRNSKNPGQEEYFVDALEVVAFGSAFFYRSMERPKAFLVPVTDYEVLEVRETRLVLKNVGVDKAIKIGGGKEAIRPSAQESKATPTEPSEPRVEKKRERRKHYRKRRGRDENKGVDQADPQIEPPQEGMEESVSETSGEELKETLGFVSPSISSLLPPPPKLISETIEKYKNDAAYQGAFFEAKEEEEVVPSEPEELASEFPTEELEAEAEIPQVEAEVETLAPPVLAAEAPSESMEVEEEVSPQNGT